MRTRTTRLARTLVARTIAAATALALSATVVHAQVAAPLAPRYRFAVAAGINLANMTELDDSDMRAGFVVGGQVVIPMGTAFAFQPEIYYAQKGAKGSMVDEGSGEQVDITLKNDYIEIPLLARLSIVNQGGGVQPFLLVGPSIGINMSCEIEGESQGVEVSVDCDELVEAESVDLGAMLGGGLDFPMGTRSFSVGARYTFGFNEVFQDSDSKNRVITLLAGITF